MERTRNIQPRLTTVTTNGIKLNLAAVGRDDAPLIICLHGFPEYWAAWRELMAELASDFLVVAPDQRGFNLSSKPSGDEAYKTKNMVADVLDLAEHLSPGRKFILAGHDWGASIAYAFAFAHADRLSHLVIVNGVHPVCFQRAIVQDPDQRRASQYFLKLRAPGAARRMAENNFARTINMIAGFSKIDWMTPEICSDYIAAWSQPGAMEAMLRWYNSSPIVVPALRTTHVDAPLLNILSDRVRVAVPHLVIWGEADEALRPSSLAGLSEFAPDLAIKRIPDAGHWILHEKPAEVAATIRAFVGSVCLTLHFRAAMWHGSCRRKRLEWNRWQAPITSGRSLDGGPVDHSGRAAARREHRHGGAGDGEFRLVGTAAGQAARRLAK